MGVLRIEFSVVCLAEFGDKLHCELFLIARLAAGAGGPPRAPRVHPGAA